MYDLAGRATGIATSGSAGDIVELGYVYSPGSLVTSRSTSRSGGAPVSESVTWDAAARLSTISSMSSGVPVQYTPSHEVTRGDDGAQLVWGADGSLVSRTLGTDVTSYASDLLGKRTSTTTASGDVASFAWDQVGRLTGVADTASGSVTDFTYSGGLRIGAETTTGEDTTSEAFQWDTLAGVPLLLSDAGREYIYALGTAPVAQVDTTTGAVVFLHGDLVGSTRAATDATGTVVGAWDYSTFGVTTTATGGAADDGAGVTRFLFAGEYLDDTGLYYLRARFYDPVTASFLSVDPALAQTGSPYAYAAGNPLQVVDPLGLWAFGAVGNAIASTVASLTSRKFTSAALAARGTVPCESYGGFFGDGSDGDSDWNNIWGSSSDQGGAVSDASKRMLGLLGYTGQMALDAIQEPGARRVISTLSHLESLGPAWHAVGTLASIGDSYMRMDDIGGKDDLNGFQQFTFVVSRVGAGEVGAYWTSSAGGSLAGVGGARACAALGYVAAACAQGAEMTGGALSGVAGDAGGTWWFDRVIDDAREGKSLIEILMPW